MRTSTKIWLIIAIVSNIALWFFFSPIIEGIKFESNAVSFAFGWEAYLGIVLFLIASVSGTVIFNRFIRSQPLNRQIFFSTIPPTATFVFLMLFFFTITTRDQTDIVTAVRVGLGIGSITASYIWISVIALVYALFMYVTYSNLSKPVKKIGRAVEVLRNGKSKKTFEVGKAKQFKEIEEDLNQINENYKQQEKIMKSLMIEKEKPALEKELEENSIKKDKSIKEEKQTEKTVEKTAEIKLENPKKSTKNKKIKKAKKALTNQTN